MGTTCSSCALTEDEINEMDMKALKEGKCTNSGNSAARSKAVASAANSSEQKTVAPPVEKIEESEAAASTEHREDAQPAEMDSRLSPQAPKHAAAVDAPMSPGSPCLLSPLQDAVENSQGKSDACSTDDADNAVAAAIAELQAGSEEQSSEAAVENLEEVAPSTSAPPNVPFQFKPSVGTWLFFRVPVMEMSTSDAANATAVKAGECESSLLLEEGGILDSIDENGKEVEAKLMEPVAFKADKADPIEPDDCKADVADLIKHPTSEADKGCLVEADVTEPVVFEAEKADLIERDACKADGADLVQPSASEADVTEPVVFEAEKADLIERDTCKADGADLVQPSASEADLPDQSLSEEKLSEGIAERLESLKEPAPSLDEEKPLKDIVESLKDIVNIVEEVETTEATVDLPAHAECIEPQVAKPSLDIDEKQSLQVAETIDESQQPESPKKAEF